MHDDFRNGRTIGDREREQTTDVKQTRLHRAGVEKRLLLDITSAVMVFREGYRNSNDFHPVQRDCPQIRGHMKGKRIVRHELCVGRPRHSCEEAHFSKKVALFGLGDQEEHSETFADALYILYRAVMRKGAILGALSLYLDFINLFLLLLRIFGRGRD